LLVEGFALAAEEGEFLVGGGEDCGDGNLFVLRREPDVDFGELVVAQASAAINRGAGVDLVKVNEKRAL